MEALLWPRDARAWLLDALAAWLALLAAPRAVFAWAHGTNVEILMFVESRKRKEEASPYWCAGFSRLGSASLTVDFQDRDFWSSPSETRPTQSDSYYYRMETLGPQE